MKPSTSADDGEWVTHPDSKPLDLTGYTATPEALRWMDEQLPTIRIADRDLRARLWRMVNRWRTMPGGAEFADYLAEALEPPRGRSTLPDDTEK